MRQTPQYIAGLAPEIEIGKEAAKGLDNKATMLWFEIAEKNIITELMGAEPGSDGHSAREGLVAQIRAIRLLKTSLSKAVAGGKFAESKLEASMADD